MQLWAVDCEQYFLQDGMLSLGGDTVLALQTADLRDHVCRGSILENIVGEKHCECSEEKGSPRRMG